MEEQYPKGIGYLLERTTRLVKLNYSQAFKKAGYDITPEQWVVLESLYLKDGQTQNDLANGSFKDAPTISRILNILENRGYLARQAKDSDKRIRYVRLTNAGRTLVEKMETTVTELRKQGWSDLSREDYEDFVRIINRIFANYEMERP